MFLVHKGKPERTIDPQQLEELFAQGLDMRGIARELNIYPSMLYRKISDSLTLQRAKKNGLLRAKATIES